MQTASDDDAIAGLAQACQDRSAAKWEAYEKDRETVGLDP
jgi:hypothetical protein